MNITATMNTANAVTDDPSHITTHNFINDPIVESGRRMTQYLVTNARKKEKLDKIYRERIAFAEALQRDIETNFVKIDNETKILKKKVDAFTNQCVELQQRFKTVLNNDERSSPVPPQDISRTKDQVKEIIDAFRICEETEEAISSNIDEASALPRSQRRNISLDYNALYKSYVFSQSPEEMLVRYINSSKSISELVKKFLEKIDCIEKKFQATSLKHYKEGNEELLKEFLKRIRDYPPHNDQSDVAIPLTDIKIKTKASSLAVEEDSPVLHAFKTLLEKHNKLEDLQKKLTKLEHDFEEKLRYRNEMKSKVNICRDLKNGIQFSDLVANLGVCFSCVYCNLKQNRSKIKQYVSEIFRHMMADVKELNILIKAIEDKTDLDYQYMERMFQKESMIEKFNHNRTNENCNSQNWECLHNDLIETCNAIRNKIQNWELEQTSGGCHNETYYILNLLSHSILIFDTRMRYFQVDVEKYILEANDYDWIMGTLNNIGNFDDAMLKCETLVSCALSKLSK